MVRELAESSLFVKGRVDAAAAPELSAQLSALSARGVDLIHVDLAEATYLSSSGLRALLLAQREQQCRGGRLVLCNVPPKIRRVLSLCGFDRVLTYCDAPGH